MSLKRLWTPILEDCKKQVEISKDRNIGLGTGDDEDAACDGGFQAFINVRQPQLSQHYTKWLSGKATGTNTIIRRLHSNVSGRSCLIVPRKVST